MANAKPASTASTGGSESRRKALLDAAYGVFARYGYRKTSMDEVARAAQMSRQGVYLYFTNKEDLFRATLQHAIDASLAAALGALEGKAALPERLLGAFDEWIGRHVGQFAPEASDLAEAANTFGENVIADGEKKLLDAVATLFRESGLAAAYKPAGLSPRHLAENLVATSVGMKHRCATRDEFRKAFAIAVRITCAPLAA